MDSKTKVLTVAIVAILLAGGAFCALHWMGGDDYDGVFPEPVTAEDKAYPTSADGRTAMEAWVSELETKVNDTTLSIDSLTVAIYDAVMSLLNGYDDYYMATLDYQFHPTEMESEYLGWMSIATDSYDMYMTTIKEALNGTNSDNLGEALEKLGEDPEYYLSYNEETAESKAILEERNRLITTYNSIMGTEYTYKDESGKIWTLNGVLEALNEGSIQRDTAIELFTVIERLQLTDAVEIYIDLVELNNEYAVLMGYENYLDYAYEVDFGRDYTSDDIDGFLKISDDANLLYNVTKVLQTKSEYSTSKFSWVADMDRYELRQYIEPFMDGLGKGFGKLIDYLYEYELLYTDEVEGQLDGGYCQSLQSKNSVLIYMPSGNVDFMMNMVHELGHACNMCLTSNGTDCYDIMEIHSQGLEVLFCNYADENKVPGADALFIDCVNGVAFALTSSCRITEIETWAYETDASGTTLTVDSIVAKYTEISVGDSFWSMDGNKGYEFVYVQHIFNAPGYYISYGLSALNTMEIWIESVSDYDAAKKTYMDLITQSDIEGYKAAVEAAGLSDMLIEENGERTVNEVLTILRRY